MKWNYDEDGKRLRHLTKKKQKYFSSPVLTIKQILTFNPEKLMPPR